MALQPEKIQDAEEAPKPANKGFIYWERQSGSKELCAITAQLLEFGVVVQVKGKDDAQ